MRSVSPPPSPPLAVVVSDGGDKPDRAMGLEDTSTSEQLGPISTSAYNAFTFSSSL